MSKSNLTETRVFITWMEDGICFTEVKPGSDITLQDAIENTAAVKKVSGSITGPILVDLRRIRSISKEARDHFSMRNRIPGVNAIAMLIKSPVSRIIGNFFLGLNKPVVSTQLFTSREKAMEWAEKFSTGS
jgi:hypothetical protein